MRTILRIGALLAAVPLSLGAAGPTDNLRADYRNPVNTNRVNGVAAAAAYSTGVQLGVGSGFYFRSAPAQSLPNLRTSLGVPITAELANRFLGDKLTPPDNWNGAMPVIENTGGRAEWIDYDKSVILSQSGPVKVTWTLKSGSKKIETVVVAASPNKRPVRLYWTHERPSSMDDESYRSLQNAGPTVQFGSNYKVTLYGTGTIAVYDRDRGVIGDVRLLGTELQAFEGARGTFLVVYSRLDEALNERKMLAYEIVEVMDPMQTQLDVAVGDQLRPITRDFDTNELFPQVTRGLTDESENGEIYVYQHGAGEQKNYIWAIRDSSDAPWKIEVFWRAKEELDVIWPFEVDIYSASWNASHAQVFLRKTKGGGIEGEAEADPKVYVPGSLGVEAMAYQVPQPHVHTASGVIYTDYAGPDAYSLLKFTSGDLVWFQMVHSVAESDTNTLARYGCTLADVTHNRDYWTGKEEDFRQTGAVSTEATLAEEIRAPFAGEDGFFYPGWVDTSFETTRPTRYPVKDAFNPALYAYPTEYKGTNDLYAPIYPVNIGELKVWWSLPAKLNGPVRAGSGHVEPLTSNIFFPSLSAVYQIDGPKEGIYYDKVSPQIVLASGKGSAGWTLYDNETEGYAPVIRICDKGLWGVGDTAVFTAPLAFSGAREQPAEFTVEGMLAFNGFRDQDRPAPWMAVYGRGEDGVLLDEPDFALHLDGYANIWVNGVKKTSFTAIPNPRFQPGEEDDDGNPVMAFHAALTHDADGNFVYYVNGREAARFADGKGELSEIVTGGSELRLFPIGTVKGVAGSVFAGDFSNFRIWAEIRSPEDIFKNRYLECGALSPLIVEFGRQSYEGEREEGADSYGCSRLENGVLRDTSPYGNHGGLGYVLPEDPGDDQVFVGTQWTPLYVPVPGVAFAANAEIYRQPNRAEPGYNPNEEHALLIGGIAHALRCDLNNTGNDPKKFTSLPYVLVQYGDPDRPGRVKMTACRVVPENDMYRFESFLDAGFMFQSPDPLARFQPANLHTFVSGPLYGSTGTCFKDRKGWFWAHQAADDGGMADYTFEFEYPSQESFDFPEGVAAAAPGEIVKWMADYTGRDDSWVTAYRSYNYCDGGYPARPAGDAKGTGIDYVFHVSWPEDVKGLYVTDTLLAEKDGLPAVRGQLSANVVYEQSVATGATHSVKLIDPTRSRKASLKEIPGGIRSYRSLTSNVSQFTDLPPFYRDRLVWNPEAVYDLTSGVTEEIAYSGKYIDDETSGFNYVWLNTLDEFAKASLSDPTLVPGAEDAEWTKMISSLPSEPYELTDENEPFDSLALTTTGMGAGYVTLVFNNSTNDNVKSESVVMKVIRVIGELKQHSLHVIKSTNPLDKKLNMKVTSDFGGHPEYFEFTWRHCEPVGGTWSENEGDWMTLDPGPVGSPLDMATVGDEGVFGLSDHWVKCRYRAKHPAVAALVGTEWQETEPQLYEGWVKRVLKAINPFDQRLKDFENRMLNTDLSMIQQAGTPYNGDIPLNQEALDENGLLAIYETVLREAKKLSIESGHDATEALALAIQMAAGRIAELYTVLGNEALADAMNPTVDLGSSSPVEDGAESSIFPFMNQCENLLEEELCLLRGRDLSSEYARSWRSGVEPWSYPVYNRLQWNETHDIAGGMVAYNLNYGISDVKGDPLDKNGGSGPDGTIDAYDAANLYPQGHGDAYGHYLSALKGYYALLKHESFGWKPQIESILAGQTTITISYLHEKRFALAAAQKARTAEKIVADTYRWKYRAGEADPWLAAEEDVFVDEKLNEIERDWGVDEWATRGHLGAYYDWLTVNALLPSRTSDELGTVRMLDRESTCELSEIAAAARRIQSTADYADAGMNPLGISDQAVPFDISPAEIDAGKSHYEQIRERAGRAVKVAHDVFDRVKKCSNALRDQNESRDFENMVADEEKAIERRLIEIFGYPYADDIGPGKLYPQGYSGPDLYHYDYIETYDLDKSGNIYGRYFDVRVDDYSLIATNVTGVYQAEIKEPDYGILGDAVLGVISWTQDKLDKFSSIVDPWTKYAGVSVGDTLQLPVSVINTDQDHMDGKVDYSFHVAAWSNYVWYASYYVGAYGFTPKPESYHGQRHAEGECQIALSGYQVKLSAIKEASQDLHSKIEKLRGLIDELTALDYTTQMGYVTDAAANEVKLFNDAVQANANTIKHTLEQLKDIKSIITDTGVEALPKMVGLATDISSLGRAALLALKQGLSEALNGQINKQTEIIQQAQTEAEKLQAELDKKFETYESNEERLKKVAAIKAATCDVQAALGKLEITYNDANAQRMNYAKVVAEGQELIAERERLRIQWAADLSQSRYRNMMYQILRNDELQRYNEAFEQAAKYVYLAAKAYDYETGLLESDSSNAAGSEFMSRIVRSRALGRFNEDGEPLGGGSAGDPGLADILFRMDANWSVLRGRLGFNNPQTDVDRFSLRRDLLGKTDGADGDAAWRSALAGWWTDDLRVHPVFARLAQPFDPMKTVEPGFAIPFRTLIAARKDLFGNDLQGGSTAYSSTYFATKLREVGVWVEGDGAGLPVRPEVYLIPSGTDYMRVPVRSSTSAAVATRGWNVVDQVLPLPYELADSGWDATDWSMLKNVFGNELCQERKHPAIRAHVGTTFDPAAMNSNARLIGRSVWNDQWWLFIPAASLNADDDRAKAAFLDAVRDIHLNFRTYSLSGN